MNAVPPWAWRELDAEGARASWAALSRFVDWVAVRYELAEVVPACWWRHGAITEELTALWAAWTAAYLDPDASPDAPITWHERFAGCRARLSEWDRLGCAQRGHRDDVPTEWAPDIEDLAAFVEDDVGSRPGGHRPVALAGQHQLAGHAMPSSGPYRRTPEPEGPPC